MNQFKHTPGPWKWRPFYEGLDGANEQPVLNYAPFEGLWLSEMNEEANARLIAAAPDMLDALMHLAAEVRSLGLLDVKKRFSLTVYHAAAEKVIRKATTGD